LSRPDRERIAAAIDRLPGGDVRKLRGVHHTWRLRVGEWRVLFSIDHADRVIDVLAIRPRGRAYD
jgi:mRNA interferase RelE/StbE